MTQGLGDGLVSCLAVAVPEGFLSWSVRLSLRLETVSNKMVIAEFPFSFPLHLPSSRSLV